MQAFQGGLMGGHKSTPGKHKHMLFPPSLQLSTDNWRSAWQQAGPVHENGQPLTTQSVRGTVSFHLQAFYGMQPARQGYIACWVKSLCMLPVGQWLKHFRQIVRMCLQCKYLNGVPYPANNTRLYYRKMCRLHNKVLKIKLRIGFSFRPYSSLR
jgi:hypothetical protein